MGSFSLRACSLCLLIGCASLHPLPEIAKQHNDRGLAYLDLAASAADDHEERRACDRAEQSCRLAIEYDARFAQPHNCLGLVELSCHRSFEAAAEHFKDAINLNEDFAEAHNNLGVSFQERARPDYESAREEYLAALEIDPGYANARSNLAVTLMHLRRWKEARDQLMRLVEIAPLAADAYHHLGVVELADDDLVDAEHWLKQCIGLAPEHVECHYELGNVYLAQEKFDDAIAAYAASLRHPSPIDIAARQNMRIAFERAALFDGAIVKLLDRFKTEPGNPATHFDLGVIFAERGLLAEAIHEWETATHLAPDFCPAHHRLALAANRVLDARETETHCRETIDCAHRTRNPTDQPFVTECEELLVHLH